MRSIRFAACACVALLPIVLGACGSTVTPNSGGSGNPSGDTTAPTVLIASPIASGTYFTSSVTVALSGTATDDVGVVSVSWRNLGNGASGSASGTASWSVAVVTLAQGSNQITVTARDAAGNSGGATLTVSYNPGGTPSLSGGVDSSLINRGNVGANMVYLYSGAGVTPGDIGGSGVQPVATAPVTQDNGACTFSYRFSGAPPAGAGAYTVAFVNQTDNPSAADAITFRGTTTVTLAASGTTVQNFAPARRLQVGPTRTFKVPSAAIAAAQAGDVIEIDAGDYPDDNSQWSTNNLTLRGVGGARPHLHSTQQIGNGKGIFLPQAQNAVVENIEFSGATVADGNGAGIRNEANSLTVCNSYFHDNENGILGGVNTILIEYSEFDHNGLGDGFTHNMYIDGGSLFTLRYSYTHRAHIGHNVKSRAQETRILYNRITDEDGDPSYSIDIPQVGRTFIIGNLIEQGPNTDNSTIVAYGAESALNVTQELYVVNNTVVNDRPAGGAFFDVRAGTTAKFINNIFAGPGTTPTASALVTLTTNLVANPASQAALANAAGFDYHLTSASTGAIGKGTDPGTAASVSLTPTSQYVHPTNREDRPVDAAIDIGAYEFQ